jgi:hypothetical protein
MKIALIDLRKVYQLLYEKILSFYRNVDLAADFYWCTAVDERENLKNRPTLCLGSLEDDWSELIKVPQREFASLVDVQRFANILISIGQVIQQKNISGFTKPALQQEKLPSVDGIVLRISAKKLFDMYPYIEGAISLLAHDEINCDCDLYWTTLPDERETVDTDPELSTGSLKNDWRELENLLQHKEATCEDINRFANVLLFISEAVLRKS